MTGLHLIKVCLYSELSGQRNTLQVCVKALFNSQFEVFKIILHNECLPSV